MLQNAQDSAQTAEMPNRNRVSVPSNVSMIGLSPHELPWIRRLITLLRHPDPTVAELTRQALLYLSDAPKSTEPLGPPPPQRHKNGVMLQCRK